MSRHSIVGSLNIRHLSENGARHGPRAINPVARLSLIVAYRDASRRGPAMWQSEGRHRDYRSFLAR